MLTNIKNKIKELAKAGVIIAEETLGSDTGKQKKEMAVNYVIERIPISSILKPFVSILLSSFIDDAIEFAVEYMETQK